MRELPPAVQKDTSGLWRRAGALCRLGFEGKTDRRKKMKALEENRGL